MSFLHLKLPLFVLAFFLSLTVVAITFAQDEVGDNIDLEIILSGVQHYDKQVRSGKGKCILTWQQTGIGATHIEWIYDFMFDQNRIRIEFEESFSSDNRRYPKTTVVVTSSGIWEIKYHKTRKPHYSFQPGTQLEDPFYEHADPRQWFTINNIDAPTYLKLKDFFIKNKETLNNISCYVLEAKPSPATSSDQSEEGFERCWIAPGQGFRCLKHEKKSLLRVDVLESDIKKGTPSSSITSASYQQYGDIWLPKKASTEHSWIDADGTRHLISRMSLETKDFKVNHPIPAETFTVEIPDDALIWVGELHKELSKKEFLERYGQK